MSNINNFANSSYQVATDEDFNLIFWLFYAGLIIILLGLMPLAVFPPVAAVFVVLAVAPALFYAGLWAVVGVASLINTIEKKVLESSPDQYRIHAGPSDSPEPCEAPNFQEAPASILSGSEFNPSAAQFADPLSAQTYTDARPVEYGQPLYPNV